MDKMNELRTRIDKLDDTILSALEERFAIAEEIGAGKRERNMPVRDVKREREIYDRIGAYRYSDGLREVYSEVFAQSRRLQK